MNANLNILPVYKEALFNNNRYLLLFGGRGSGKSKFAAQKLIIRLLNEKNHKLLIVRKYAVHLKNSVYSELLTVINELGLASEFDCNVSPLTISCKLNNNKILFVGLDDGEKLKSITGITSVWIEEATQLTKDDFSSVDLILRGQTTNYKQIILTFNPIDSRSWLNIDFFINKIYNNCFILKTTYKDNPYLSKEYEQTLESYKGNLSYYSVIAYGDWGIETEKLIFNNFTVEHINKDLSNYSNLKCGVDFGYNDPNVCLLVNINKDEILILKEFYKKELTNEQFLQELKDSKFPTDVYYICDSARPEAIKTFKNNGLKALSVKKNKDSIKNSINLLKNKRIIIDSSCVHTIEEIETYQWLVDKNGNILDEVLDKNNHCMDALRYSIDLEMVNRQAKVGLRLF